MDQWLANLDLPSWQWWIVPVAGVAVGLAIGWLGGVFLSRRGRSGVPVAPEGDPFALPKSPERRESHRREGAPIPIDVSDADHESRPVQGWVVDRSLGGLCVELTYAVQENTVLSIRPSEATAPIPWTQIEVRSCRQSGDRYQLGCQFLRTPPYSILMLFG